MMLYYSWHLYTFTLGTKCTIFYSRVAFKESSQPVYSYGINSWIGAGAELNSGSYGLQSPAK